MLQRKSSKKDLEKSKLWTLNNYNVYTVGKGFKPFPTHYKKALQ